MGSKPPAAVDERICKGGRHDLGAAAPWFTRAFSPEQGGAGGPVQSLPTLVGHIGSGSSRFVEQLPLCIACTAVRRPPCARSLVFARLSASMARRGCQASCSRRADPYFSNLPKSRPFYKIAHQFYIENSYFLSAPFRILLEKVNISPPAWVDQARILAGGRGQCPQEQPRSPSVAC